MELLFNDLSIHGQFRDLTTFKTAVDVVMSIRARIQRFGRELYSHRNVVDRHVTPDATMRKAVGTLDRDKQRAVMTWLTRHGPFWEDGRAHDEDDYLDCVQYEDRIVTDTAVGEAAYGRFHGLDRRLVSIVPSAWERAQVRVDWHEHDSVRGTDVPNYWDADTLVADLDIAQLPLASWRKLEEAARTRCPDLEFARDSFAPLAGHPFHQGAAERILVRLCVLQEFKNCFDERGERSAEGHRLYEKHFTGDKAWFSDSSTSEKDDYRQELTFPSPSGRGEYLFCTWHGKVKTPQLRIHFSWPARAAAPLYIVYVGPKITKR